MYENFSTSIRIGSRRLADKKRRRFNIIYFLHNVSQWRIDVGIKDSDEDWLWCVSDEIDRCDSESDFFELSDERYEECSSCRCKVGLWTAGD